MQGLIIPLSVAFGVRWTLLGLVYHACTPIPRIALTPFAPSRVAPERRPQGSLHSLQGGPGWALRAPSLRCVRCLSSGIAFDSPHVPFAYAREVYLAPSSMPRCPLGRAPSADIVYPSPCARGTWYPSSSLMYTPGLMPSAMFQEPSQDH